MIYLYVKDPIWLYTDREHPPYVVTLDLLGGNEGEGGRASERGQGGDNRGGLGCERVSPEGGNEGARVCARRASIHGGGNEHAP